MRPGWLIVFARFPRPGLVKTRLCPPLSPDAAADLYACMLGDALDETQAAAQALGLEAVLALEPGSAAPELAARVPRGFRVIGQRGPDLAGRMAHALGQAAAAGCTLALLRGSDSPAVAAGALVAAGRALSDADVVIGPDPDGGYHLIGLGVRALGRGIGPGGLFAVPMSTASVLRDTQARCEALGLASRLLAEGFDVDRFEDLCRLAALRHASASLPCPRTLAFLDERGLWPDGPGAAREAGRP